MLGRFFIAIFSSCRAACVFFSVRK